MRASGEGEGGVAAGEGFRRGERPGREEMDSRGGGGGGGGGGLYL